MIRFYTLLLLTALMLGACTKPAVVFKEVKIPVACDVQKRERPESIRPDKYGEILFDASNIAKMLVDLFSYTEGLERDLDYCRGLNKKK